MIEAFAALLGLIIIASVLQAKFKIPSPITLISAVLVAKVSGLQLFQVSSKSFDAIVVLAFPLLIAADVIKLKWSDIRENWFSLFWVAVISVLLSVGAGILISQCLNLQMQMSVAAVAVLFAAITATDPVTVSAVLSNFKVPHKLKLLVEGESLFNDATAVIVFSIAAIALTSSEQVTGAYIGLRTLEVVVGSVFIGAFSGILTFTLLKLTDDMLVEAAILLMSAYAAYMLAEHYHLSGILAVIVATLLCGEKIRKLLELESDQVADTTVQGLLQHKATTRENLKHILKVFEFSAMFAASALFVATAALVEFETVMRYWQEILVVFLASTIIRALAMWKFAAISHRTKMMPTKVSTHWWAVLTFAGSKGALSLLMVHLLPNTFMHKSLFEVIVIGNIILSTFVYAAVLAIIIPMNRKKFDSEVAAEGTHHS